MWHIIYQAPDMNEIAQAIVELNKKGCKRGSDVNRAFFRKFL